MIARLVPGVVATAWRHDDTEPVSLFPEETAVVARAVAKRRREFATVRLCARLALRDLGLPATPLTPGPRGEPRWPRGVAGSMTHCAGYRAAALARTTDVVSIGIDAEPAEALPEGVFEGVTLPEERRHLATLADRTPELPWGRLLFSAKESVFKTWYPLTGRGLEFEEATLEFTRDSAADPHTGTFRAGLSVPGPVVDGTRRDHFTGRWLVREGLVLTAIVLTRDGPR
ncbi:4'-phosphopantetheinyl transferase family protein [Streptomyces sp. P9-A4]|uniref:4'-phosphopantetheinyl transferase family protein n=2 Tax=unclassified Streptomyces TaxID=2593676 RepID=UPI002FC84619